MSDKPEKEKKAKKEKKPKKAKKVKEKLPKPADKKHNKICPNCKTEIPKKAKVCPSCAAKQKGLSPLVFVIPLTLVLILGAGASVFLFHFPINPPFELPFQLPTGPTYADTVLGQGMELKKKQEAAVQAILTECGFVQITQVERVAADSTTTSYAIQDANTERFMATDDPILVRLENKKKTVHSITFQSNGIYVDGAVVSPITDYYMGMETRDKYMETVIKEVKKKVDLPELAVFPSRSHWVFTEEEENVLIVESTVTTKDGTGAETVRPFRARIEKGKVVSVTFTGED